MYEALIALLNPLTGGEVYWGRTPPGHVVGDAGVILLSQDGGTEDWYVDQSIPDKEHARIKVAVFTRNDIQTRDLLKAARDLIAANFVAKPYGAPVTNPNDDETELRGSTQYFGIWH